ncbi:MAG: ABC transporter permease, partial [Alphaproteobacteria bacterium]|nr:ABC transporter permease [Alphaproteobacteria bacterium]
MAERAMGQPLVPPVRPEFENRQLESGQIGAVMRPLSLWERISNITLVRRMFILVMLAVAWESYARYIDNPLMFPTFSESVDALWDAVKEGVLFERVFTSIRVLLIGYGLGLGLAAVFTTLAVSTRIGTDLLSTLTAMFNPLPAIALLPLALLWFGLGI